MVYNSPDDGVMSDASGAYRLEGVSAGEVTVVCHNLTNHGMRYATVPRGRTAQLGQAGTIDARFRMQTRAFETIEVGGQAEKAGLLLGDEVIAVDGTPVTELTGGMVMQIITGRGGGNTAMITIKRGAVTRGVPVTVRTADS